MHAYALTVRQPFASLIAYGDKIIEWRTWTWNYRGPLVICASKSPKCKINHFENKNIEIDLPTGAAVCIVDMVDCRPMLISDLADACCDDMEEELDGKIDGYAFVLENAREVEPVPVKGKLRPWIWDGPELVLAPGYYDKLFGRL